MGGEILGKSGSCLNKQHIRFKQIPTHSSEAACRSLPGLPAGTKASGSSLELVLRDRPGDAISPSGMEVCGGLLAEAEYASVERLQFGVSVAEAALLRRAATSAGDHQCLRLPLQHLAE